MNLFVSISSRYYRTSDGTIWTTTSYDQEMWREHHGAFEEVVIFARVLEILSSPPGARIANGPGISFCALPEWAGARFPMALPQLFRLGRQGMERCGAALLHSPSPEAEVAFWWASRLGVPFAVACRGDQSTERDYLRGRGVFVPGLMATYFRNQLRRHIDRSWGCIYVSEALRRKYPPRNSGTRCAVISDLRLPDEFFSKPKDFVPRRREALRIVSVGRLEAQKDYATAIRACSRLRTLGISDWQLHLIGGGPEEKKLRELADSLGAGPKVVFHGFVPWSQSLFELLSTMDLFVLSSINEGMPRALLEAMARGLPCIATRVSGATELLDDDALVPVGDAETLARRIAATLSSPDRLNALARGCWNRAQDFRLDTLRCRQREFLLELRRYAEGKRSAERGEQ